MRSTVEFTWQALALYALVLVGWWATYSLPAFLLAGLLPVAFDFVVTVAFLGKYAWQAERSFAFVASVPLLLVSLVSAVVVLAIQHLR